ncbi:MAG: hypothetical protein IJV96_07000 [Clostridia bacterium]|nr:hypothetical protein [Clostridia bacterium]
MFDDLKKIGKKRYRSKGIEEELSFSSPKISTEIFYNGTHMDISITFSGSTENYKNSLVLTEQQKKQISTFLLANLPIEEKSKSISKLLIDSFEKIN